MPQARVVLRDAVLEKAEKLQEVTQVGSISELISVMFSRYGSHLEQTWEVKATSPTYAQPEPPPSVELLPEPIEPPNDFSFDEPIAGL